MENVKKILELDISDKKKSKLIESYLDKKEYPVNYPNITWTYPYAYDPYSVIYSPITSGVITNNGSIITSIVTHGISAK